MKKTALAIVLISVFLFSSAELVRIAEANAYWIYEHVDPVPGTIPPSITIYNPQNNTSYYASDMTVNVLVNMAELAGWHCKIEWVDYSIDGRNVELYSLWQKHEQGEPIHPITIPSKISFNLSALSLGRHTLTVSAGVTVLGGNMQVFFLDCNSTVHFTIDNTPSSPSSSPSTEPTIEPESLPTSLVIASSIPVAVVLVGLGLLLHRIKRK